MTRLAVGLALLLVAVMGMATPSMGSDWLGWRGDGSGISADAGAPTEWTPSQNVAWKTEIPGRGISSPIVTGNRVFVTTAYEVESAHAIHSRIRFGMPFVAAILLLGWWIRSRQMSNDLSQPRSRWFAVTSVLFLAAFFGSVFVLEYIQSPTGPARLRALVASLPRLWLASGAVAALGVGASMLLAGQRKVLRWIVAIAGVLVVATYFSSVPDDPIAFQPSPLRPLAWALAIVGLVGGLLSRTRYGKWSIAVSAMLPVAVIAFLVYVHRLNPNVEEANAEYPGRFWLLTGLLGAGAMFVIGRQLPGPDGTDRSRRWLLLQGSGSLLLLGLVTTHFYVVNFLLPTQGIMRSVVCVDATTGQLLWEQGFQTNRHERIHRKNSHATPTPVTDGRAVYAYFGDAGLLCVDFEGRQLWLNRDLPYRDKYGAASSPVLGQGLVFLSCIDLEDPYIAAIDQKTGVERWRHRMQLEKLVGSYAAPWYGTIQGRPQLVINGGRRLMGLDPESGNLLWQHVHEVGEVIPSPVVTGNSIVGGGDRRLVVYGLPQEYLAGNEPAVLWETSKGAPFHCSTLSDGAGLYTLTDEGVLTCFDLESGKFTWRQRLDGAYTSSPVLVGQLMYLINRDGTTTVLDISQRGQIVATNDLGELCESSIAIAGGRVYIRSERNLLCIGNSKKAPTTAVPRRMEAQPQGDDQVARTR